MTVTSLPVRDEFTASAAQTVFNYTFLIFTANDLNVYITPAGQEANDSTDLTTAYTVDVGTIGNPIGGFITLDSGATSGDLVTIVSSIVEDRTTDYQNSGDFLPDTVNDDFDRVVSIAKQTSDKAGRTLAFQESVQNASSLTLPSPLQLNFLRWKSDLTGLENIDLTVTGSPTDSSVITYDPPFTGSTLTDVETKLSAVANIKDFGGVGDGVTDDTVALEAWFAYGQTAPLTGDKGTYLYTGNGLVTATDLTDDFVLTGNGMTINCNPSSEQFFAMLLKPADASTIGRIEVTGVTINGNAEFAVGLRINDSSASNHTLEEITVHNVIVDNLDNANLASITTTAGIRVDAGANNISIKRCSTTNITRTQVNPTNISSVGIGVFNATGIVTITQNTIEGISSPFSPADDDADGIVVFGAQNGTPTALDSGKVTIDNNDFKDCKGRCIKSQHTNTTVNNNRSVTSNNEVLIINWRFADFQNGGGICTNNLVIFGTGITAQGAGSVSNAYARFSNVKDVDRQTSMCSGNVLIAGTKWQQIIISKMTNGDNSVNVHDNDFAQSNLMVLHDGDTGDFNEGFYVIHDNTIEIKTDSLFEAVLDQNWANLFVSITDNQNIDTSTGLNRQVFPLGASFSLQSNFVVGGNKTMIERVQWVFDFDRIHIGSDFVHGTQVNTNAPFTGADGNVNVGSGVTAVVTADALTRWHRVVTATGSSPTFTAWKSVTYA